MQQDLEKALLSAVDTTIQEAKVAVAFSGGIDSSLLAKVCQKLGKDVTLLTIGFPRSHDIEFSKKISALMELPHKISLLDSLNFQKTLADIREKIGCSNTSHIENCVAFSFIAGLAKESGLDNVLTANGCDELFCGYNGYRLVFDLGKEAIEKFMDEKIANEFDLMAEISRITEQVGVRVRQPFLSSAFIDFAKTIPIEHKINGKDDLLRKHILRQVALSIGVPEEAAMKPKKAIQYGSLIHKHFKAQQKQRRRM